jgi:hypothetical protein
MNKPKGWYNTVLEINKELELRKQGKDFHPLDLLLSEQTKILIQLFNECEFVGFPKADTEAETIVSNVLVSVQNSLTEKMDFVPDNPFFNLYLGLCYLEKVLQLIKNEYESNLNTSIEYLENIIYQSDNYKNLVEVSRSIGRNIINNKQHPDFGILKKHIAEQLEYIERNNITVKALPPQQTKTDKLKAELGKYGFFELLKVKQLSEPNKQSLVELISTNDLPYSIAMVEYLGFIKHLKAEHFTTDYKLFKAVANWFEVAERAVKGNIYVLNEFSKENRTRYTADQQKQTVQKNYEALK